MIRQERDMFSRIMGMVMAVILLVAVGISSMSYFTLRNQQISARLDALMREAREIAYLAARNSASSVGILFGQNDSTMNYIRWKSEQVYADYGAYILVVDRRGRVMDNMRTAYAEDPDFVASLDGQDISLALTMVLSGQEVALRLPIGGDPAFMVGVPFVQNDNVLGAVLIQTKAQVIEGGLMAMIPQTIMVATTAMSIAAALVFFYVRSVMRPLGDVTRAARAMADGNFNVRVSTETGSPEITELSTAFNSMAGKLSEVESNRREFVANVSHELRSPITSISGFVEGMEDGTIPAEEHPKYLALVGDETRRLSKLIGDLLALSRLERDDAALEWSEFDINEMLRRAIIRRVNDLESKRMEVECDFQLEPCLVRADSDRIEQVVVNLLDNAIKFTPQGGKITLTTGVDKDICTVVVQDNGVGIPPEDRGRVFDRFFTADRAHTAGKGTGLGLSICQRIMEMHGQSLRLKDTEEGTAFAFTLEKVKAV
ncbi:MAG: HAMP domain-containing histidine kinase [Clostridia bacterium]|nr:HAMP domain-containing histidine kinase [Clostridia bacterium]